MSPLNQREQHFLERRTRLLRFWPVTAGVMLLSIAALALWMLVKTPYLINPYQVARALTSNQLPADLLPLMALFLPICVVALLTLVVVMIGFGFAVVRNEQRYQSILSKLMDTPSDKENSHD